MQRFKPWLTGAFALSVLGLLAWIGTSLHDLRGGYADPVRASGHGVIPVAAREYSSNKLEVVVTEWKVRKPVDVKVTNNNFNAVPVTVK